MEDVTARIGPQSELAQVAWKEQNLLMSTPTATTFGLVMPWPEQLRRRIEWQRRQAPQQHWLLVQEPAPRVAGADRGRAEAAAVVSGSKRRKCGGQ